MNISRAIIVSLLLPLGASSAWAGGHGNDQVLGAVVGGVFGGVIGNEVGGRDGAIVGAGLGALTGVALTQGGHDHGHYEERHYGHDNRAYYGGRGHYERYGHYDRGYHGQRVSYEHRDRDWHGHH
jgi:hypothetical protein